jgi:hypothetical protein
VNRACSIDIRGCSLVGQKAQDLGVGPSPTASREIPFTHTIRERAAKRYSMNVGVKAIQEVAAGAYHYKADHAVVITSAFFTNQAKQLSESVGVELVDRNRLITIWAAVQKNGETPLFDLGKYEKVKFEIDSILGRK